MQVLLYALVPGIIGGILNSFLVQGGWDLPYIEERDGGRKRFVPGGLSNTLLGGAAGYLAYSLWLQTADPKKAIGLCLLAGIAGGNFVVTMLQRYNLIESQRNTAFLTEQLEKFLKQEQIKTEKRKGKEKGKSGTASKRPQPSSPENSGSQPAPQQPENDPDQE